MSIGLKLKEFAYANVITRIPDTNSYSADWQCGPIAQTLFF
jgi:hypothetical protein